MLCQYQAQSKLNELYLKIIRKKISFNENYILCKKCFCFMLVMTWLQILEKTCIVIHMIIYSNQLLYNYIMIYSCQYFLNVPVPVKLLSRIRLFRIPWTVAYQVPPSVEVYRQEYQSRLPFPSPGDLSDSGIEPRPPTLLADALLSELPGKVNVMEGQITVFEGNQAIYF